MHPHQLSERLRLHFFHYPGAVYFHGPLTDAELISNHFVRLARDHEVQYFLLTVGQFFNSGQHFRFFFACRAALLIRLNRFRYAIEKFLVAERFLDEINRTFLHRVNRHWHVAMTGNKDDRQGTAEFVQFFLQLKPAEARHADIKDQATRSVIGMTFQKFISGVKDLVIESDRAHQKLHRVTNCLVVIDDVYGWFLRRGCIHY